MLLTICAVYSDKKCGKNEVKSDCAGCELKCGQSKNKLCTTICRFKECYCSPHAYRRNASGKCVRISECPRRKRIG
ncbi:unnamed protein product [Dracunculus medinensis]|uniref:TIL domain-containing protein n=1 Tax=Dracunculus medinensis TaxID=318479 RepID=A0A0N4UDD6_DRAME|nr:unnamed protein product [Dracunculus medinensis]